MARVASTPRANFLSFSSPSRSIMSRVSNPILPGFHPDPSILRVGNDYYIATSTFEWWPGVRIHHSRDLVNWNLAGHALTRPSQVDLRGTPPSGGVWAPALSHAGGLFWLVYSDVKSFNGCAKDVRNYLVTSVDIAGPWSEPVPLNSSGFDPSLFHDDDGRKWLLNQVWDPRPDRRQFAGIALQEFSAVTGRLIGTPVNIFRGSSLGITEGPHLYKRDGNYYLVTAEGGTRFEVRSHTVLGDGLIVADATPIEAEPPVALTDAHRPLAELLELLAARIGPQQFPEARAFADASWVGYRLAELLPLPLAMKQRMLETADAEARLAALQRFVGERGVL